MLDLCRKARMARRLSAMASAAPQHYSFFPATYVLPADLNRLLSDCRYGGSSSGGSSGSSCNGSNCSSRGGKGSGRAPVYIFKPDAGCQGRGIRLVKGGSEPAMLAALAAMPAGVQLVAQHYLDRPLTIARRKFDLRIYALVTCVDPLRCAAQSWGQKCL